MERSNLIPKLGSYLEQHLPQHLDLLRQMVAINSFTANPVGVNALGRLTADAFAGLGFNAEFVRAAEFSYGNHLILTRAGLPQDGLRPPTVGLISHLDTVYPEAEERDNEFHWRVSGKRIYGPGVVDIKGGTVMIYTVLAALKDVMPAFFDSVTWMVLLNAAEEALVPDFGQLCLDRLGNQALAALVFEGGEVGQRQSEEYRLVVARKGMARFHLRVEGKAAHAGTAHANGANAILQLADVVRQLAAMTDYEQQVTFNVGSIAGGTVINRVPHQASASLEMRAYSPQVFAEAVRNVMAFNAYSSVQSANDGYPCRVEVDVLGQWEPWAPNASSNGLAAIWRETGQVLGFDVITQQRGGLSDGNWTWAQIPTLDALGPDGGNAHCSERSEDGSKDQEYVLPASYVPKGLMNALSIVRLVSRHVASTADPLDRHIQVDR